jgi:hypothetical protein
MIKYVRILFLSKKEVTMKNFNLFFVLSLATGFITGVNGMHEDLCFELLEAISQGQFEEIKKLLSDPNLRINPLDCQQYDDVNNRLFDALDAANEHLASIRFENEQGFVGNDKVDEAEQIKRAVEEAIKKYRPDFE